MHQSRFHSVSLTAIAAALALVGSNDASAQQELPSVQVHAPAELPGDLPAPYPGGYVARGAHLGVLGKTDVMDAPVSITSYTADTITNTQTRSVTAALSQLDPAVREEYGDGTSGDAMMIRGFPVSNDDIALNGLPGILGQFRVSPEFIERAEVLKGPSVLLNGMSPSGAVGGAVNLIAKRAGDAPKTALNLGFASESLWGFNVDIGRRFGEDNAFGIRVNAGARQGDMARDYVKDRARNASVGLDFNTTRVRASLDLIHQTEKFYGAAGSVDLSRVGGPAPAAPDGRRNAAQPWYFQDAEDTTVAGRVEFDLTDRLTVFGAVGRARHHSAALVFLNPYVDAAGNFMYAGVPIRWTQDTTSSHWGMKGHFETGAVRHDWSLSASDFRRSRSALLQTAGVIGGAGLSNIYDPVVMPEPTVVDGFAGAYQLKVHSSLPSYALVDTLSFAQGQLLVTLGMRHQRVKSDSVSGYETLGMESLRYDRSVNSPMAAVVFKATQHISLYANHIQGVSKGDIAPYGTANQGAVFAPYRTRQTELGVKFDHGHWGGTLGVFQITQPYASIDPVSTNFVVDGEQRHRGIELNVFGEVTRGVRVLGGATFMNAEVRGAALGTAHSTRPVGVARRQFSLQGEWDLPGVNGLTLTSRVNAVGDVYADSANLTRVPGWTTYELGLRYATKAGGMPMTLRASVQNVGDKRYWRQGAYAATPGMPRTLAVSSTFEF